MTLLASGFGNCEMSNYLVWSLLRGLGYAAYFFETGLHDEFDGTHLLIYTVGEQGATFVDAWSDVPYFHLTGFVPQCSDVRGRWLTHRFGSRRTDGVPTHAELCDRLDLVANGLYPATAIRAGRIRPAPGDTHPRAAAALRSLASATLHDADPLWRD
jgi:hypothetical protein